MENFDNQSKQYNRLIDVDVLVVRDYYTSEMVDELMQVFKNIKVIVDRVIPESIAFVMYQLDGIINGDGHYFVINTYGSVTSLRLYKYSVVDSKVQIEKDWAVDYEFGDDYFDKLIFEWIKSKIILLIRKKKATADISKYIFYPYIEEGDLRKEDGSIKEDVMYCNIAELHANVKKVLYSTKEKLEIFEINFYNLKNENVDCLIEDLIFDMQDLRLVMDNHKKDIDDLLKDKLDLLNKETTSKFCFGVHHSMIIHSLENVENKSVSTILLHGADYIASDKCKIDDSFYLTKSFKEIPEIKKNYMEVTNEIKVFVEFCSYKDSIPELVFVEEEGKQLMIKFSNADKQEDYVKYNKEYKILDKKNNLLKKNSERRPISVKMLQDLLDKHANSVSTFDEPLIKTYEEVKKWFNENKDNKDVLAKIFDDQTIKLTSEVKFYEWKIKQKEIEKEEEEKIRIQRELDDKKREEEEMKKKDPENQVDKEMGLELDKVPETKDLSVSDAKKTDEAGDAEVNKEETADKSVSENNKNFNFDKLQEGFANLKKMFAAKENLDEQNKTETEKPIEQNIFEGNIPKHENENLVENEEKKEL